MCGIVGAIAERNVVPILMEGLRRLEYRGYDSAGLAVLTNGHLQRQRRMGKVAELQSALDAEPMKSNIGIAHTRWATHGVPSEKNAHPHISHDGLAIVHNGIIENHEQLRDELQVPGLRVHLRHRHRGHRPPDPLPPEEDAEPLRGGAGHRPRAGRRLRAGGDERGQPRPADPGPLRLPGGGRPRRQRELRGLRRLRAAAGHPPLHLPGGRRRGRDPPQPRAGAGQGRQGHPPAREGERALRRRRREGPVPPLHAEGDPRAAPGRRPDARGAGRQRQAAGGRLRPQRHRDLPPRRGRAHRGLRHQLPRGLRGPVPHRAGLPRALPRGHRQRVPLPEPGRPEEHPVRHHLPVRRDGRHPGGPAAGQGGGLPVHAGHLQRAGELAGPRVGAGDAHPRRPRDRRGLHQGLHHPDRGADHAGHRARQAPHRRRGAGARASCSASSRSPA